MDLFAKHLPTEAVTYCVDLCQYYAFQLKIVKSRRSRLGDFRAFPTGEIQITVNADLNPFAFLITFVHEVAHADVYTTHSPKQLRTLKPHGQVWQTAFRRLMQPLLNEHIFPQSILTPLQTYMLQPAASTYASPTLIQALRQVDDNTANAHQNTSDVVLLEELPEGELFKFQEKTYLRGTLRRTRVVCKEVSSSKSYAILAHAWVEKL